MKKIAMVSIAFVVGAVQAQSLQDLKVEMEYHQEQAMPYALTYKKAMDAYEKCISSPEFYRNMGYGCAVEKQELDFARSVSTGPLLKYSEASERYKIALRKAEASGKAR